MARERTVEQGCETCNGAKVLDNLRVRRVQMDVRCSHLDGRNVGAIAQLVERFVRNEKVRGSIPLSSTSPNPWNHHGSRGFVHY